MKGDDRPVYMIGVAAELCGVHPQTLRQYERLGLVTPKRVGAKNRLYSDEDVSRVRRIQRLTQEMGVNLAGVELILRLLDEMEQQRADLQRQMDEQIREVEERWAELVRRPEVPIRVDETLFPVRRPLQTKGPSL